MTIRHVCKAYAIPKLSSTILHTTLTYDLTMAHANINSAPSNLFSRPDLASNHAAVDVFLYPCHSPSVARELIDTANALVSPRGKGIYATDEAPDVIAAMLEAAADDGNKGQKRTQEELNDQRKRWRVASYEALSSGQSTVTVLSWH